MKGHAMPQLSLSRPQQGRMVSGAPRARITLLQRILGAWRQGIGAWRQRQHLDRLPDHMRRDIGLNDRDIAQEVARPLWDVPTTWRD